jgi:murein DD-endopeptidase MepM/ murein hydrolase activator NlpD
MRRLALALVIAALLAPTPASASADAWTRPVPGPVVRPLAPPKTRYGPGHVGVDFRALPGTPVRAAGAGQVTFAGAVARTRHVVVRHANGRRTSYSFLASIRVHAGDRVDRGEILGTTGGAGEQHDGSVLHLGLRIGDDYADPMQLFGAVDLASVVHLAPLGAGERDSTDHEPPTILAGLPAPANPIVCRRWTAGWCRS